MNPAHERVAGEISPAIKRLYSWLETLDVRFVSFVNVSHERGDFRPSDDDIDFLWRCLCIHDGPIIALGTAVSRHLRRLHFYHFKLPHPSGRNRVLNNPRVAVRALHDCAEWVNRWNARDALHWENER